MEITLYRSDWEPFKDCSAILDYPVDAVLIEVAGCTLEVTPTEAGAQVKVLTGKPDIIYSNSVKGWFAKAVSRLSQSNVSANSTSDYHANQRLYSTITKIHS